uniref:Ig-like domain-containing protein n=1 Tax=Magallana gigas TaxID=29159 RepID=A0A8W8I7C6_MAGGI
MTKCKKNLQVVFLAELIVFICEGSQSVNLPPWITSVFEPEYYVPAKHPTPLNLQCKAKNGIISYQWFKNNVKFQTNDRVGVNEQSGDITFHNLTTEDFGVYYCVAENKHGSSVSSFVKILEAALNGFSGNVHGNIICKIFHHCKIPCSNQPNCQPINECTFEWRIGRGTGNKIKTNENVIIDSEENNDTVTSKAIWKNNPKARIGENATLQCIFSGSPVPNIDWLLKNGSVVKPNSKFQSESNGRHLFIRNVTFDDDGVYTCVADKSNLTMNSYLNVTKLIVIICEGSQSVNLPPWITSVFEPEYYVPAKHPTPLNLQCKAKNGIIRRGTHFSVQSL